MVLRRGSTSEEVKQLQEDLALLGFAPGSADGIFGAKTEAAVRAFQESVDSLSVDGIVGPKTSQSIAARVGPKRAAQRLSGTADVPEEPADDDPAGGDATPM